MKRLFVGLFSLTLLVNSASTAPIDDARLKGLAWLIKNQSGDGSWRGAPGLEVTQTAAAVEALANAGISKGNTYASGVAWLQSYQAYSTDSLSRQAIALAKAGRDTSGLITQLINWRNDTTLSWGAYDHYSGSFPDTALAMDAIKATTTNYANAVNGISFIAFKQNTDGGWPVNNVDISTLPSKIIPTAHNLRTLNQWKTTYVVQSYINNGISWLKSQQLANGGFGEGATGRPWKPAWPIEPCWQNSAIAIRQ